MRSTQFFRVRGVWKVAASAMALLVATSSLAVSTDIADVPLAVKNAAKPNIMFILDNSGSMAWRSITGSDATAEYGPSNVDFYSSQVNQIYYDPNTRYTPGINKSSFTSTTLEGTSMGEADRTSTGALNDPYLAPTGSRTDLTKSCYYDTATPPLVPSGGTNSGNCRNQGSTSYRNGPIAFTAYYYEYTGTGTPTPGSSTSYTRRNILSGNAPFTRNANRTDCTVVASVATCTYAQELQNFANWFSYYRTRMLTMKTTMGQAFASLTSKYRLGFSTINNSSGTGNNTGANFLSVEDFDSAKKISWYTQLYAIDPANGTPLQRALQRAGEYYQGNGMGYTTSGVGADDPVQYSCQANYTILSTDGFWNSNTVTSIGNTDLTVPTIPVSALDPVPNTGLTAGATWPRPYYEGATASSNTLADVALYYWIRDLRDGLTNNVPVTSADKASWQHMTTFTIGLGADGSKDYREDYLTATSGFYSDVLNGADNWPVPAADTNRAIDDLWHAAVNGHGQYFSAKSPTVLRDSLRKVLDDIVSRVGSGAAVAVANADLTIDNTSYASKYNSGNWSGDLQSYVVNPTTGIVSSTPEWSAQEQLDAATVTADNRRIVTSTGGSSGIGILFRPASATDGLSATQQNYLNSSTTPPGPSDGGNVLAFIRGARGEEGAAYRSRASRLGDIVNAEPVVIGSPMMIYNDNGYAAFKASQLTTAVTPSRVKTVFQAANDGMVHAFQASDGVESWAYVPSFLFNGPSKLRDLSKRAGFSHQYYVDATPVAGDVDFGNTCPDAGCPRAASPTPDWRTVLVGGLGKGGRGYYALDVTTPTATDESDAADKVLWEFPNSGSVGAEVDVTTPTGTADNGFTMSVNKIGSTYGKPLIVKTKAHGWVALVTSGYNNASDTGGDGHGYLFVLNARTGVLLHVFDTGAGDSGTTNGPSGLAYISAFVPNAAYDSTVEYIYAGDLFGNVWRFDLNNPDTSQWQLKRLTQLVDASTVRQPVTTAPELATILIGGVGKRFVFVGTGQYFGDSDIPGASGANTHASQTQTMYGLVDDLSNPSGTAAVISPLRSNLVQQTLTTSDDERTITENAINFSTKKGWYVDLPVTGERVNTQPVLAVGALVFTSNIPNSDVCTPGGSSWLNILDYKTGGAIAGLNGQASWSMGDALSSRPVLVQLGDGTIKVLVRTSNAETKTMSGPPSGQLQSTRRASWREVLFEPQPED